MKGAYLMKMRDMKMRDMKMRDMKMRGMKMRGTGMRYIAVLALLFLPLFALAAASDTAGPQHAEAAARVSAHATGPGPERVSPDESLPPGATVQNVVTGLNQPVAMAFDPAGRLFYTERNTGNVRLIINGVLQPTTVIHFDVTSTVEQGLLGVAIDPNFNANHLIYVYYTCSCTPLENRVAHFVENNGIGSNPQTIFTSPDDTQCGNHNGGNIHFGPDGKLFISIGDDGCTPQNAQDVTVKNGKMHRINPDGTIPSDNPVFTQTGALPSLYAMGLRNSFDFSFDPIVTGRIFASENGPSCDDEMNRIEGGYNYGWRASYPCDDAAPSPQYNTIAPLWYIPQGPCCVAPTGIEVYRGASVPQWTNDVFMCSYNDGALRHFHLNSDRTLVTSVDTVAGVTCKMDIQTGPDGALYYLDNGGYAAGNLKRIVGSGGLLTATVAPSTTSVPSSTVVASSTAVPSTATRPAASATTQPVASATTTSQPMASSTATSQPITSATATPQPVASATTTSQPMASSTATTYPAASATSRPTGSVTPTVCPIQFQDVPPSTDPSSFYPYVRCLACRGILGGYACGGVGEPCGSSNDPYFRPGVQVSRGQIAKIVSESAGLTSDPGAQIYEDVAPASTFYPFINRLSSRGYMGGYACGGPGEPCGPGNRPYFRPSSNATRGQLTKIVANAAMLGGTPTGQTYEDVTPTSPFYMFVERLSALSVIGGYPCGSPGEPCGTGNRPYFRPNNPVTRAQAAKIVANTFFPNCQSRNPTPTAVPAATSTPVPATASPTVSIVDVTIRDYAFDPATITVTLGTTVRWTDLDLDYHTVTSTDGSGELDSSHIQQGETYVHTFNEAGQFDYNCVPHPYMLGSVVVTP